MAASIPVRLASIDAYRGFVMLLMMAEVLHLGRMAKNFPNSEFWQFASYHQSHVEWRGCSLHDLIQPSFSFLVGVALPFSLANRLGRGQTVARLTMHACTRAGILVLLGVFLRSVGRKQTNWTFEDTLSQIGLGYVPLFLLGLAAERWRYLALIGILAGYFTLFALHPVPGPEHSFATVGVPNDWQHHPTGFAAHWDKNSNPAWAFDTWFLNLFPREKPFTHNSGGYATLSFIPTLATMILGLIAGAWLQAGRPWKQILGQYFVVGLLLLGIGTALDQWGICPSVKRIWTPSWVLVSGGWCFLLLGLFVATTDATGYAGWSYPLRVIGANSIVAYVGSHLIESFVLNSFKTHLGGEIFLAFGQEYEPVFSGACVLLVYWLILWWMYRNRIFVRI